MTERAPRHVRVLPGARRPLVDLAYGTSSMVAVRADGSLDLLSTRTGGVLAPLPTRGGPVAITDELGLVWVAEGGRLRTFDLVTAEPGRSVGDLEGVRLLLPHPDGVRLAVVAGDALGVLHGETGRFEPVGDATGAESLAWSRDQTAPIALRLPAVSGSAAASIAHQPGTDLVAVGHADGSVSLRDDRGLRGFWVHHPAPVRALRFTPLFLVTASADGTIAGWDVREAG